MTDKIVKIADKQPLNESKVAVENIKRNLPALIEHSLLLAKLRKTSYEAHLAEGFSEAQALELCKNII